VSRIVLLTECLALLDVFLIERLNLSFDPRILLSFEPGLSGFPNWSPPPVKKNQDNCGKQDIGDRTSAHQPPVV
jgi:hypothetical protein